MTRFASSTSVTQAKSRDEIERTLQRYGGASFMYGQTPQRAMIAFELNNRRVKFELPMPSPKDAQFWNRTESEAVAGKRHDQACRQRWRALALVIKAKLEAVETGITTFDEEFLAHIVLPNGQSVGEYILPGVRDAYESKKMPPLLGKF